MQQLLVTMFGSESDRSEQRRDSAKASLELATELNAELPETIFGWGWYYYQVERDWEKASDYLRRAAGVLRGSRSVAWVRANLARRMGKWEGALRSYALANSLDPRTGMDDNGFFAVGRAVAGTRLRVEVAGGQEASPGQTGEVVVGGTSLMRGYWRDAGATGERLASGWFHTRDLGYLDEDGRLHLVGRESTLINVGNEKVSPEEVEKVLMAASGVDKAAVYGVPDPLLGESVRALVVAAPGASLGATDVQTHCRGKISGYKIPRRVRFVESLPETLYGKIDRKRLHELDPS